MDSYSVAEASRLLGVSAKRVRQLVEGGKLVPVEGSSPLQIEAKSVLEERQRREVSPPRSGPSPSVAALDPSEVLRMASEIASSVAKESVRLALEAAEPARREAEAVRDRTEESLREALAAAEARATTAEAQLAIAVEALETTKERLDQLQESAKSAVANVESRRRWRRRKGGDSS